MTRTTLACSSLLLVSLACERAPTSASPSDASTRSGAPAIALEVEPQRDTREANPDLLAFAFVTEIDGREHVVLSNAADPTWGVGALRELFPGEGAEISVGKQVFPERLPPELAQRLDRTLELYDAEGTHCTSKLGEPLLVAQYGWGTEGLNLPAWDEQTQTEIEYPPARIATAVWETQPIWLVAPLDEGACAALWARDAELPAPDVLHHSEAPNPIADAYAQAFRASAIVPDMRTRYENERAGDPYATPWPTRMANTELSVSSWLDARDQVHFLELEYGFDDSICGSGYDTEHREFTQVVEGREYVEISRQPDALAIVDLDLDGRYEMLFGGEFDTWSFELVSDTPALATSISIGVDFVCPC